MITAIPNQPIDFIGPAFPDCSGTNPSPLKIGLEDTIIFQFLAGRCGDAEQLFNNTDFTEWSTQGNWDVKTNDACALEGQGGAYLALDTFNPVVGDIYEVELVVTSIVGSITFTMGGYSNQVSGPGLHTFVFVASTTEKPIIYMDTDETAVCLFSCEGYDGNEDITVSLVDKDDVEVFSATFDTHPQYFTISEQHVTFIAPVSATGLTAGQCFKVFVTDACFYDEDEMCSQTIEVIENCDNTIKIRACNDTDQEGMGFVAGRFEVRLPIQVVRPKYEYKSSEEKLADGTINRPYISRSKAWDMVLNDVFLGTSTHDFVSALCMFDHFYIGTNEYILDAGQYEPSYGESQTNTGAVTLTLRPKIDQFTKIACAAPGAGCNPINDPICNEPNVTLNVVSVNDGQFEINVAVSSMLGFQTSEVIANLNGVDQAPVPLTTAPQDIDLGPYDPDDVVVVTVVNADDAACNKTYDAITIPYCIIDGGPAVAIVVDTIDNAFSLATNTGFVSYLDFTGTTNTVNSGSDIIALLPGKYCFYPSDDAGVYSGQFVNFQATGDISIARPDGLEGMPVVQIAFLDTILTTLEIPFLASECSMNYDNSASLTHFRMATGQLLDYIAIPGCALDQASVDHIITTAYESCLAGSPPSTVQVNLGTNSAPSAGVASFITAMTTTYGVTVLTN